MGRSSTIGVGSQFIGVTGDTVAVAPNAALALSIRTPAVAVTASNLSVFLDTAPGAGASRTFSLSTVSAAGTPANTSLSCTIAASAQSCTNTAANVSLAAGTLIAIFSSSNAGNLPASTDIHFGFTIGP